MIYLDTHVVVWLYAGLTEKFSDPTRELINSHEITISPIVRLELQYLYEKSQPLYNSLAQTQPFLIIPASDEEQLYNIFQNKRTNTHKLDAKLDYYYLLTKKSNINITNTNK